MSDTALAAPTANEGRRIRRGDRQTRFLAQSVILEEGGSTGLIRVGMITIGVVICAFLVWAAATDVDEVAATSGEVIPTGQVQAIQHLEGGIISQLLVVEGEMVDKGQTLLRLDAAGTLSEQDQLRARVAALHLQSERLRAIGLGVNPDWAVVSATYQNLIDDQKAIYESVKKAAAGWREVVFDQIKQRKSELAIFVHQEETLSRNIAILEEELAMREQLFQKGLSSKIVYLDVQRQVNQAHGDIAKLRNDRTRTREALGEAESRLAQLDTDLRETALREMGTVTAELAQLRENLNKAEDKVQRLHVKAPVRGIVKGLKTHTIGGVITPGQVALEIVPLDKELVVETRITTRDVGHVQVGQPVTVKVTTFDFARYGGITGELKDISASTFLDEKGNPFYKGIVSLDRTYVGYNPERNRIVPGMTVQADVHTGRKTLLEYLLKPIYSSVSHSFRER
ncbi:MAG: HlyD family type I secretion periplasmic adaptor subunit [Rhodospirillales bacterium]|nr:HlyD family type I secretion periplasmic adaptor subunit [Rhodospirillales bacterium]